ncbi:MAG: YheT family hydrolase [Planctomycetaceae bacterium]
MVRIARKLTQLGVRAFRLDLRGCGAGRNLACQPYHAGRWGDLQAAAQWITSICPASDINVAGFSLGGNLVLRWLGEALDWTEWHLGRAVAVNPPIDLAASTENIARSARGLYDRHFSRLLYRQVQGTTQWRTDSPLAELGRCPDRLMQFDELFTAPLSGFKNAAEYYQRASAAPLLYRIGIPTLILSALDDPLIPPAMFTDVEMGKYVLLHLEKNGGHLGYIAARGQDPDRHWMDWRVVDWLTAAHPATAST